MGFFHVFHNGKFALGLVMLSWKATVISLVLTFYGNLKNDVNIFAFICRCYMEQKYSKMDQVTFLKAVLNRCYLVHSWILCHICKCNVYSCTAWVFSSLFSSQDNVTSRTNGQFYQAPPTKSVQQHLWRTYIFSSFFSEIVSN